MPTETEPTRDPAIPASRQERFLGLTKIGWVVILVALMIVMIASLSVLYSTKLRENHRLAVQTNHQVILIQKLVQEGVRANKALCALAEDLQRRIDDGKESLARSKAAFAKNPNLLPSVPRALIEAGWEQQQKTIDGQIATKKVLEKNLGRTCKVTNVRAR